MTKYYNSSPWQFVVTAFFTKTVAFIILCKHKTTNVSCTLYYTLFLLCRGFLFWHSSDRKFCSEFSLHLSLNVRICVRVSLKDKIENEPTFYMLHCSTNFHSFLYLCESKSFLLLSSSRLLIWAAAKKKRMKEIVDIWEYVRMFAYPRMYSDELRYDWRPKVRDKDYQLHVCLQLTADELVFFPYGPYTLFIYFPIYF